MIELVIALAIGTLIGWNFPQPDFAVKAQNKVTSWFK